MAMAKPRPINNVFNRVIKQIQLENRLKKLLVKNESRKEFIKLEVSMLKRMFEQSNHDLCHDIFRSDFPFHETLLKYYRYQTRKSYSPISKLSYDDNKNDRYYQFLWYIRV